jgi:Family of unknown function (DUF6527)
MKLTEFSPQLVKRLHDDSLQDVDSLAEASGLMLDCPVCAGSKAHSVLVYFRDRGVPAEAKPGPGRWSVAGSTFEDLTLTPSVDCGSGCWHGFITKGEVT